MRAENPPTETSVDPAGSRAEYRRSRGIQDDSDFIEIESEVQRELPPAEDDLIIDAEVMDEGAELIAAFRSRGDESDRGSDDDSAPDLGPLGPQGPAMSGLLSLEAAVSAQAAMKRDGNRAQIRTAKPK